MRDLRLFSWQVGFLGPRAQCFSGNMGWDRWIYDGPWCWFLQDGRMACFFFKFLSSRSVHFCHHREVSTVILDLSQMSFGVENASSNSNLTAVQDSLGSPSFSNRLRSFSCCFSLYILQRQGAKPFSRGNIAGCEVTLPISSN